jgi:hypothetical protein
LVLVFVGVVSGAVLGLSKKTVVTTTTSTTTTTTPIERPQAPWKVATASARGVMVDYRMIDLSGVMFRAIRLRARTTLLRWHVGYQDPPTSGRTIPVDAGSSINWPNEGVAGVVAVFNGGFKVAAHAGGSMVDGVTLSPLVRGDMTLAIDAAGHWKMGVWAPGFPGSAFHAIAYRQNLGPMIANGSITKAVLDTNPLNWGSPLKGKVLEPRSALGIDAKGNLIFVATMWGVSPTYIARALIAAGAVEGMQLDINPYWPIAGAGFAVLHHPGDYNVQIPFSEHNPDVFNTGWERDFFVAVAEPPSWNCSWKSAGLGPLTGLAQPQPLHEVCSAGPLAVTTTTAATNATRTSVSSSSTDSGPVSLVSRVG